MILSMIFLLKLFVITASENFYRPPPFGAAKHLAAETILVIFSCSVDVLSVS